MRLVAPMVALILMGGSLHAQHAPAGPTPTASSQDAAASREPANPTQQQREKAAPDPGLDVPVSLDRIRGALAQPPPAEALKGLNEQPTFRLEILERQRFEQLMDKVKFEGGKGPEVAGGRANYELQRLLFPPVDNPLVQPYAAFSTGEVLTLGAEALIEKLVTQKLSHVFGDMLRSQAEREAREEVARNLAALQAARGASTSKN
jgi:hypothetical protein